MREYRDFSNRLSFDLSDDHGDFSIFAERMVSLHGSPTDNLSGLDQNYWDFNVGGVTLVLHSDTMAGVSIYVEDGTHEALLRTIAKKLLETNHPQNY